MFSCSCSRGHRLRPGQGLPGAAERRRNAAWESACCCRAAKPVARSMLRPQGLTRALLCYTKPGGRLAPLQSPAVFIPSRPTRRRLRRSCAVYSALKRHQSALITGAATKQISAGMEADEGAATSRGTPLRLRPSGVRAQRGGKARSLQPPRCIRSRTFVAHTCLSRARHSIPASVYQPQLWSISIRTSIFSGMDCSFSLHYCASSSH